MKYLTKKPAAIIITAIIIILSSLWSGSRSLSDLEYEAMIIFDSSDELTVSIQEELDKIAASSSNLTVIAKRYLPPEDNGIQKVTADTSALSKAETIADKLVSYNNLSSSAFELYDKIGQANLSDKDKQYVQEWRVNFYASVAKISRSPYNETVQDFNKTIEKFPTNIMSKLVGAHKMDTFN